MLKHSMRVSDYMLRHPVSVHPDDDIFEAIHQILMHKISGVCVVDSHHHCVGVLSELDCLRAILTGTYHGEVGGKVREFMSAPVETIAPNEGLMEVAQSMLDHKRRRRPVVDAGTNRMVGQVTCRQILKAMKDWDAPEDKRER